MTPESSEKKPRRPNGTGRIYPRGAEGVLWIAFHKNGKRYFENTHTTKLSRAQAILKARLAEVENGSFNPQQSKVRVGELMDSVFTRYQVDRLKSIDDAKARWELHLKPEFEFYLAANVTSDALERYVQKRLGQKAKPATINRELALLKRGFSLGMQATPPKVRFMPHFPHLKENNVRVGFVTETEADKISAECSKVGLWAVALFTTLFEFGFRVSEALNLRVRQLDFLSRSINLNPGETKNGCGRTAIMTSRVYELLKASVIGKGQDEYVFTRENGNRVADFRGTWEKVITAAELPGLLVHDLRRSAIKRMIQRGIPQTTAMKIAGQKTESVFRRYAIVSEQDLRDAARRLEQPPINTPVEHKHETMETFRRQIANFPETNHGFPS